MMVIKFKEYDIIATPAEVLELLTLCDKEDEAEVKEATPAKPKQVRNRPKHYKKELDVGKMKALRKANWTLAQIADEMRCSPQTVANKLKEA